MPLCANECTLASEGRILFLIQQGDHSQAIALYNACAQMSGQHDYELLHRIGLGILDYGYRQSDPEIQLLSLFGAGASAHEDAYYILEDGLKNRYPQIQLIALSALAKIQNDRADQAMLRAMGSNQLLVRLEAAKQLCLKKHPEAVNQTESFMYKSPKALASIYPPLLASAGTPQAIRILRKLLHHSSEEVRLAVILNVAKYKRDDLLPQIRQQAFEVNHSQQEAGAYALGLFHDAQSQVKLQKLAQSTYPTVALAAQLALYRLGDENAPNAIEQEALKGNLFALSALSEIPEKSATLENFVTHSDTQVRINAILALLRLKNPVSFSRLKEILLRNKKDLAFIPHKSPGKTLKVWKVVPSASQTMQDDMNAYQSHLELKESIVETIRELSEASFLALAHQIFNAQQNDLVPLTATLLEDMGTTDAIACLKAHQQQLGAPLVRHYCNLALYRLQEPGPYGEQLRQWVKTQNKTEFIRFQAGDFSPWDLNKNHYNLTPEEASQLLIKAFEAFAINQDAQGIESLLDAIANGHAKNKYALAGLLLRATQ
ncbi:conserved hypothetical protein [Candidatus Protochlamydia naegleriophila]|uniref:Uncharacterized protein n=1 Tax=Candidatus Protochlamydia naegleriophila TaxID=389348 RepID=A0A0U5JCL2_9BACT|nr:hypothetical protein [Candidatus Protochlamydia naegleriophila]CUI16570.1 conserved hypothetical protein [Candidatus Protochlamydia naegleriophila]